jgi:hypothetical protein
MRFTTLPLLWNWCPCAHVLCHDVVVYRMFIRGSPAPEPKDEMTIFLYAEEVAPHMRSCSHGQEESSQCCPSCGELHLVCN